MDVNIHQIVENRIVLTILRTRYYFALYNIHFTCVYIHNYFYNIKLYIRI